MAVEITTAGTTAYLVPEDEHLSLRKTGEPVAAPHNAGQLWESFAEIRSREGDSRNVVEVRLAPVVEAREAKMLFAVKITSAAVMSILDVPGQDVGDSASA
ncbi:hypothetical protein AB1207_07785 [Kineococcus endophyticus]|uniref:Uncharacterized protein n=1 Tax=Kineococcus endophyticus TaxID=1181883 RepID=A0ABV3P4V0_9ACTN